MAITFAIHEASRTGAPRVAGLIARELARQEPVRLIVMKDGPLTPWLQEMVGARNATVCAAEAFDFRKPFADRLRNAEDLLGADPCDLVYVNSLAASVFALASARRRRKTILHVHEKSADMVNLLAHDVTKIEVLNAADAVVLAADEIEADLAKVFGRRPLVCATFGIAVDAEAMRKAAALPAQPPRNAAGSPLRRGERIVVGMCGHASERKGVDIFYEVAEATPECDFVWVGGFGPAEAVDNVVYPDFAARRLPNLYVTGSVDNPYPYIAGMDLFFLSSREDPNPLALAEAIALGVPALCFSHATSIADQLGRCAILAYGLPNVADVKRVLRACSPQTLRSPAMRDAARVRGAFDLQTRMPIVRDLIAGLRGTARARELEGAAS